MALKTHVRASVERTFLPPSHDHSTSTISSISVSRNSESGVYLEILCPGCRSPSRHQAFPDLGYVLQHQATSLPPPKLFFRSFGQSFACLRSSRAAHGYVIPFCRSLRISSYRSLFAFSRLALVAAPGPLSGLFTSVHLVSFPGYHSIFISPAGSGGCTRPSLRMQLVSGSRPLLGHVPMSSRPVSAGHLLFYVLYSPYYVPYPSPYLQCPI
jgi:hypothetical protein